MSAPIPRYFNSDKVVIVKADASDRRIRRIISQERDNGLFYLIIFYSCKFALEELNYKIYGKEIFSTIEIINKYHYYFEELRY
jgi:RNase H-like domain found in reverse transcriptase